MTSESMPEPRPAATEEPAVRRTGRSSGDTLRGSSEMGGRSSPPWPLDSTRPGPVLAPVAGPRILLVPALREEAEVVDQLD